MPTNISFNSHGEIIKGHLYLPSSQSTPLPVIVLCHGFCGVKELLLPAYAEAFASNGYAALTFDYRGFGESSGEPGRLVPQLQIEDIHASVDWVEQERVFDSDRIALWGSSFGGANAIVAAALDKRIKTLLCQITFADGESVITGNMSKEEKDKFVATLERMKQKRDSTGKEMMVPISKVLSDEQSQQFYQTYKEDYPALSIKIPFLTVYETMHHKPVQFIDKVSIPVCLVAAENDSVNSLAQSEILFEHANEPKKLHVESGASHYDVYHGECFERVMKQQLDWLELYLAGAE